MRILPGSISLSLQGCGDTKIEYKKVDIDGKETKDVLVSLPFSQCPHLVNNQLKRVYGEHVKYRGTYRDALSMDYPEGSNRGYRALETLNKQSRCIVTPRADLTTVVFYEYLMERGTKVHKITLDKPSVSGVGKISECPTDSVEQGLTEGLLDVWDESVTQIDRVEYTKLEDETDARVTPVFTVQIATDEEQDPQEWEEDDELVE